MVRDELEKLKHKVMHEREVCLALECMRHWLHCVGVHLLSVCVCMCAWPSLGSPCCTCNMLPVCSYVRHSLSRYLCVEARPAKLLLRTCLLLSSLQATQKTRDFLLQRVYQLRKPMANYHMLQNQMLNYRLDGVRCLII